MIRINPIYEKDVDRLYREFFEPQFRTQRLGAPGNWHGGAAQKLSLTEPVQAGAFSSLLRGLTPEGEALVGRQPQRADRAAAWRITLTDAGPASVVLWALSPSVYRLRIRRAHTHAVRAVITDFESGLNGRPWFDNPDAPGRKSALFAEFQAGATRQQAPRLHTNLFLFNLLFQKGTKTRTFAPEEVKQQWLRMDAVYTRTLGKELSRILGNQVQIPTELSVRFDAHPLNGSPDPDRRVVPQALENRELFAAWQQQARGWGWGPERVADLIAKSRSSQSWSNWNQDCRKLVRSWAVWLKTPTHSPQRVWQGMLRGREEKTSRPTQQQSQSHSHGMSH